MGRNAKAGAVRVAPATELEALGLIKQHILASKAIQKDVALEMGITPSHLSQMLTGVRPMRLAHLLKLIRLVSFDPQALAPHGFYEDVGRVKRQKIVLHAENADRLIEKLTQLDRIDSRNLYLVEAYVDGLIAAEKNNG